MSQTDAELVFAIERPDIGTYDLADATLATDAMVFDLVYDGLRRQGPDGEWYNWMAESFEVTGAQDVSMPEDYIEYMEPYEIQSVEGGVPQFDLGETNLVFPVFTTALGIAAHPDDIEAFQNDELGVGDDMRIFTRTEAAAAVADGTYGVKIEGTLHEGITFHNDAECTASDVVGSYGRYVGSDREGQTFDTFLHATAPDGPDGYTFELYAQEPDAVAADELPVTVFPEAHHDIPPGDLDPREGGPVPLGTGPYEVADFTEGEFLLLERTDSYWVESVGVGNLPFDVPDGFPDRPVIESVEIQFITDGGQRVAALQDGTIDATYGLSAADQTNFSDDESFTTAWAQSTGFEFMQFSVQDTDEGGAFAEQAVRRAVSALAPRWEMVNAVDEGWRIPARAPFPRLAAASGTADSYEDAERRWWANSVEPDVERAQDLLDRAGVQPPVEITVETNADDAQRQDRVQLFVDALNQSDLFEATLETPASINDWFINYLIAPDSEVDYATRNATAYIGLRAGSNPHDYVKTLHHPDNFKNCCNFFHPPETFEFIDLLESAQFDADVVTDPDLRRQRYDQVWPRVVANSANTMMNYDLNVVVSGPAVDGFAAHPDQLRLLSYGLYAPYDGRAPWTGEQPPGAAPVEQTDPPSTGSPEEREPLDGPPKIDVTLDGNVATDTTGDGLLNDVDGDGSFDIFDVQAFFDSFETPVVQANPDGAFSFDGDGSVDIFDVQALFGRLSESE